MKNLMMLALTVLVANVAACGDNTLFPVEDDGGDQMQPEPPDAPTDLLPDPWTDGFTSADGTYTVFAEIVGREGSSQVTLTIRSFINGTLSKTYDLGGISTDDPDSGAFLLPQDIIVDGDVAHVLWSTSTWNPDGSNLHRDQVVHLTTIDLKSGGQDTQVLSQFDDIGGREYQMAEDGGELVLTYLEFWTGKLAVIPTVTTDGHTELAEELIVREDAHRYDAAQFTDFSSKDGVLTFILRNEWGDPFKTLTYQASR